MNEQAIRFRIGIFFLGAMLLLAVLIILFGGFPNYFKPANPFTVRFDNAPGIAPGTPVRRSGVRIGEVSKVGLDNETGKVIIGINIDPGFTLRKSDQATLVAAFLGGDTTIDFLPPRDGKNIDNSPIETGATLEGATQTDTTGFLQKASDLVDPAKDTMVEMRKTFQNFEKKLAPLMEEAFKEFKELGKATREVIPELRKTNTAILEMAPLMKDSFKEFKEAGKATREMIADLRKTNNEILELAKATRQSIPDLKKTNEEFQIAARSWGKVGERVDLLLKTNEDKVIKALDRFEDTLKKIAETFSPENQKYLTDIMKNVKVSSDRLDGLVKNTDDMLRETRTTLKRVNDSLARSDDVLANMQKATKPMAERSESILKNIEESTDKLNKILADGRELMQAVARGDGTLQKLLSDPSLYRHLETTAAQATKLIPQLEHILHDVEIFADKIARHPETLGVGGAIRPGTGLKEPPTVLPWRPH